MKSFLSKYEVLTFFENFAPPGPAQRFFYSFLVFWVYFVCCFSFLLKGGGVGSRGGRGLPRAPSKISKISDGRRGLPRRPDYYWPPRLRRGGHRKFWKFLPGPKTKFKRQPKDNQKCLVQQFSRRPFQAPTRALRSA